MCQMNTFMFRQDELDGDKVMKIANIFREGGFADFYEYNNPNLRNIRRDLRLFQCGNFCECGSVVTKKLVVDQLLESAESEKLTEIFVKLLTVVDRVYLFSHWYKGSLSQERVNLERAPRRVAPDRLSEDLYRSLFYNEVLQVSKD